MEKTPLSLKVKNKSTQWCGDFNFCSDVAHKNEHHIKVDIVRVATIHAGKWMDERSCMQAIDHGYIIDNSSGMSVVVWLDVLYYMHGGRTRII